MKLIVIALATASLLSACQTSKDEKPAEGATEAAPPAVEKRSDPAAAAAPLDDIPTEEDFEDDVEKEISEDADLQGVLDALEQEISQ